jgi:hypothetical protein
MASPAPQVAGVRREARLEVPERVLFRELGGESVLLNLASESYFGLDEVGTAMWSALVEHASVADALPAILDRYDADGGVVERDLIGLVERLVEHGLLEIRDR